MAIQEIYDTSRQLIIIQDDPLVLSDLVKKITETFRGDWVVISDNHITATCLSTKHAKMLLGSEFKHAIFDATLGFNLEAFTILAGTLVKGSQLLLLLPINLFARPDNDSLRWHESGQPIITPNFYRYLLKTLQQHRIERLNTEQYLANQLNQTTRVHQLLNEEMNQITLNPTLAQNELLFKLQQSPSRIAIVTAKRGRGKSALAGLFTHQHDCWICAPNKTAITTLERFAKADTPFFAPDNLLNQLSDKRSLPEWLVIDEAAMIPLPLLKAIIDKANRILLLTTTEGYEGTAQGFLVKLLPDLQDYCHFNLTTPIRWHKDDKLEQFIADLLLEDPQMSLVSSTFEQANLQIESITSSQLVADKAQFTQLYGLLKAAHYRTTPIDLRRLLDANNISITQIKWQDQIIGVVVAIQEGQLPSDLVKQVWLGTRRPKGNLVAQSLAAHAGELVAAQLKSLRINRIAIHSDARRQGIGNALIVNQIELAKQQGCDFVSVSFAYQPAIFNFWQRCGFQLVHIGTHQEASSGSYAAMAIYAISSLGKRLQIELAAKLARNWLWLRDKVTITLPIIINNDQRLDKNDWQLLSGFAFAHRPYEATYPSLCRLKQQLPDLFEHSLPPTIKLLVLQGDERQIINKGYLSGKQALIKQLRKEVQTILQLYGIYTPLFPYMLDTV